MADRIIVLTGGIGCGKSTVADLFQKQGVCVVDADAIAHDLTGPEGAAMADLVTAFGPGLRQADGSLDRARMRALVFSAPEARAKLEALLHPVIQAEAARRLGQAPGPYAIYMAPVWLEQQAKRGKTNTPPSIAADRLVVVDCSPQTQIARVQARNGMTSQEVSAIMAAQVSRTERLAAADFVIDNDGPTEALDRQVARLHEQLIKP